MNAEIKKNIDTLNKIKNDFKQMDLRSLRPQDMRIIATIMEHIDYVIDYYENPEIIK